MKKAITILAVILFLIAIFMEMNPDIDLKSTILSKISFIAKPLVTIDPVENSDAIVVLLGSSDRILEAAHLYKQGYGREIIMSGDPAEGGEIDYNIRVALEQGVPRESIVVIEDTSLNTMGEAYNIKGYLEDREDINSIIVITSSFHTTRAKKTFTRALASLKRDINIAVTTTSHDRFDLYNWWQDPDHTKKVFLEYLKLFNFYVLNGMGSM